jgi:hypothetical protein
MKLRYAISALVVCCFISLWLPSVAANNSFVGVSAGNTFSWSISGSFTGAENGTFSGTATMKILNVTDLSSTESQISYSQNTTLHSSSSAMNAWLDEFFANQTNTQFDVYNGSSVPNPIIANNAANKTQTLIADGITETGTWDSNGVLVSEQVSGLVSGENVSATIQRIEQSIPGYSLGILAGSIVVAAISFAMLYRKKIRST